MCRKTLNSRLVEHLTIYEGQAGLERIEAA